MSPSIAVTDRYTYMAKCPFTKKIRCCLLKKTPPFEKCQSFQYSFYWVGALHQACQFINSSSIAQFCAPAPTERCNACTAVAEGVDVPSWHAEGKGRSTV